jgi:hypothetical protein
MIIEFLSITWMASLRGLHLLSIIYTGYRHSLLEIAWIDKATGFKFDILYLSLIIRLIKNMKKISSGPPNPIPKAPPRPVAESELEKQQKLKDLQEKAKNK